MEMRTEAGFPYHVIAVGPASAVRVQMSSRADEARVVLWVMEPDDPNQEAEVRRGLKPTYDGGHNQAFVELTLDQALAVSALLDSSVKDWFG